MKHKKYTSQLLIGLFIFSCLQISAQCYEDRHNTNAFEGWVSCDKSANPNSAAGRGNTFWIRYDLGTVRSLHDLQVWNINHPEHMNDGVKDVIIEYSTNNSTWTMFDTVTIPKAPSSGMYEGYLGPDFGGLSARYLLFTPLNNYGGACVGLSEIRIYLEDIQPDEFNLDVVACEGDGVLKSLSGGMEMNGGVYSGPGVTDNGNGTFDYSVDAVGPGIHTVHYQHNGGSLQATIEVLPCGDIRCIPCANCGGYDQATIDGNPVPSDVYHGDMLTSTGSVNGNSQVTFRGDESVALNAGFEVNGAEEFIAEIRECDVNFIQNWSFEDDLAGWNHYANNGSITADPTESYDGDKSARIHITSNGDPWTSQLYSQTHSVQAGKTYKVSFFAKAQNPGTMEFNIQLNASPWTSTYDNVCQLFTNWKFYSFTFTAEENVSTLKFAIYCAQFANTYWIDEVKFSELEEPN